MSRRYSVLVITIIILAMTKEGERVSLHPASQPASQACASSFNLHATNIRQHWSLCISIWSSSIKFTRNWIISWSCNWKPHLRVLSIYQSKPLATLLTIQLLPNASITWLHISSILNTRSQHNYSTKLPVLQYHPVQDLTTTSTTLLLTTLLSLYQKH